MGIVLGTPWYSLTTGGTVVMGDELILPSALGVRSPLIRTSQLPPPSFSVIHPHPVYLHEVQHAYHTTQHMYTYRHISYLPPSSIICTCTHNAITLYYCKLVELKLYKDTKTYNLQQKQYSIIVTEAGYSFICMLI